MAKKRTKNHIRYKKVYIVDAEGEKHAPLRVQVVYSGYIDMELDDKLNALAARQR